MALLQIMFPGRCAVWRPEELRELRECMAYLLAVMGFIAQEGGQLSCEVMIKALAMPSVCSSTLVDMLRREEYEAIVVIGVYYSMLKTVLDAVPGCWWAIKRTTLVLEAATAAVGADKLKKCTALIQQSL